MVRMNFISNIINLAAVEKTNEKNIIELQYCTSMHESEGNTKIKLKKISYFFNFQKIGLGGSVIRKIKNSGLMESVNIYKLTV